MKPMLLDLFCGAGGAAMGYHRAGFEVVGVDIEPQPHYPFRFHWAPAIEFLDRALDGDWLSPELSYAQAIHASPPCQAFTAYRRRGSGVGDDYDPDLIFETRERLLALGLPFVIENVPSAPLENPVQLCGSSVGLNVRRHRLFESSFPLLVPPCGHPWQTPRFPAATNRKENSRRTVEIGVWRIPLEVQKEAMGIDWDMTLEELSEAVPPAYTELIGHQLMSVINAGRLAA